MLGNLLRDQQRELEKWEDPLSSVRKRIKAIQVSCVATRRENVLCCLPDLGPVTEIFVLSGSFVHNF